MKIGIITELSDDIINYGNCLQAYALNYYVRSVMRDAQVETIKVRHSMSNTLRTRKMPVYVIGIKLWNRIRRRIWEGGNFPEREGRRRAFVAFSSGNIPQYKDTLTYEDFAGLDYDIYIVGSDVVWIQFRYSINRIKFLDFSGKKAFQRISYAASFGRDWIPEENKAAICDCLREFKAISVRERSSVQLLRSIGVEECICTLDPTLLLEKAQWERLEVRPGEIADARYVFVYLLGEDIDQYREVERLCREKDIKIVTIPYTSGRRNKSGHKLGDIQVWECSPQNWIWMVHHAEYVVTDSFHGLAFSTIFKRKFVAVERKRSSLGNRVTEFLRMIGQEDKFVQINRLDSWDGLEWDYEEIEKRIDVERKRSTEYLRRSFVSIGSENGQEELL